jgi:hypothetical protein
VAAGASTQFDGNGVTGLRRHDSVHDLIAGTLTPEEAERLKALHLYAVQLLAQVGRMSRLLVWAGVYTIFFLLAWPILGWPGSWHESLAAAAIATGFIFSVIKILGIFCE